MFGFKNFKYMHSFVIGLTFHTNFVKAASLYFISFQIIYSEIITQVVYYKIYPFHRLHWKVPFFFLIYLLPQQEQTY